VPIAITGATGALGGRIAERLATRGVAQRLIVRDAARAPSLPGAEVAVASAYDDGDAMREAFAGCETVMLISAREAPNRVATHTRAIEAAVAAGVERIVYTSFLGAAPDATFTFGRDHWWTEQAIRETGLRFVFLRDSLYADFLPLLVGPDDAIRGPAGDGRVAAVARDDVADVAATVLEEGSFDGERLELTGPATLSLHEVAAELSTAWGRPVTYVPETLSEAYASRAASGAAAFEIDGWVTSYTTIAAGDLDHVTADVARVTGHAPLSLAELLQRSSRA
jgi:uncharacterized protein YbjT (DUF2867 family)